MVLIVRVVSRRNRTAKMGSAHRMNGPFFDWQKEDGPGRMEGSDISGCGGRGPGRPGFFPHRLQVPGESGDPAVFASGFGIRISFGLRPSDFRQPIDFIGDFHFQ